MIYDGLLETVMDPESALVTGGSSRLLSGMFPLPTVLINNPFQIFAL